MKLSHNSTIYYKKGLIHIDAPVYAFDLDDTLINLGGAPGKGAAANAKWDWWNSEVLPHLQNLSKKATIAIFTNQTAISRRGQSAIQLLQTKLQEIVDDLGFTPFIYIASDYDAARKPATAMWALFLTHLNYVPTDIKYIGDAAGRRGDFAATDRYFAHNIGAEFLTPEQYFLNNPAVKFLPTIYDNNTITALVVSEKEAMENLNKIKEQVNSYPKPIVVFLSGPPASGKSTLAVGAFPTFIRINQDTLGTKAKTKAAVKAAVAAKTNIVIDKLFGDESARTEYLALIPKDWTRICICFDVNRSVAEHLNWVRCDSGIMQKLIPDIVYAKFYKHYSEPKKSEGFDDILHYSPLISETAPIAQFINRWYV